jgi:penicillin-binding protein activator
MKRSYLGIAVSLVGVAIVSSGCSMFRASTTDMNPDQPQHMTAKYDDTDLHQLTETIAGELLASPFLTKQGQPPLMRLGDIQNNTEQHVNTRTIAERMRTLLLQSNRVQFVGETQREELLKEQEYQAKHGEKGSQMAPGQQANPKYLLAGALSEIKSDEPRQVRLSRKEVRYYNLTVTVMDLQSNKIEWTTEKRIKRQASQPLVGW